MEVGIPEFIDEGLFNCFVIVALHDVVAILARGICHDVAVYIFQVEEVGIQTVEVGFTALVVPGIHVVHGCFVDFTPVTVSPDGGIAGGGNDGEADEVVC